MHLICLVVILCPTFTLFASSLSSQQFNDRFKDLSEAEIAIIGLQPPSQSPSQPPNDLKLRTKSNYISPNLSPQESSSFITYDEDSEEVSPSKPFTITFPISRSSGNKQSVQSIVIPLPSNLDDKTGIIVIEDHDDGGTLDRRTLRAQFFSPNRIRSLKPQPTLVEDRNSTEVSVNRIKTVDKVLKSSRKKAAKKATTTTTTTTTSTTPPTTESEAEPSTISSVVFDDEVNPVTTTFSPESVFRPKVSPLLQLNKKQNISTHFKLSLPTADTIAINLQERQRLSRKFTTNPITTNPITTNPITTNPTATTTEISSTQSLDEIEITESTTFETPETTTRRRTIARETNSPNARPNIRRHLIQSPITTTTITTTTMTTTERPTTQRPTTQRPTTQRPTTQRTTTQRLTTQRPITQRSTTQKRATRRLPTITTTSIPTTFSTVKLTTTPTTEFTESDFELIFPENSTKRDFDRNSLDLIKTKNRTQLLSENEAIIKPRPPGAPQIPGNFGFLPSGKAFNLPQNVPGNAGIDYPTYDKIPITSFDCRDQIYPGFYSDMEAGCQVYHSCNGNLRASKHTFLCPNGTIFSQEYLICDWWYNVNCNDSPIYYPLNKEAFSSNIKSNSTKLKANNKRNKPKTTTTEFVIRTITTTDLP